MNVSSLKTLFISLLFLYLDYNCLTKIKQLTKLQFHELDDIRIRKNEYKIDGNYINDG